MILVYVSYVTECKLLNFSELHLSHLKMVILYLTGLCNERVGSHLAWFLAHSSTIHSRSIRRPTSCCQVFGIQQQAKQKWGLFLSPTLESELHQDGEFIHCCVLSS